MIETNERAVKIFAENVRKLRQTKGLSVGELAEASQVPRVVLEQLNLGVLHKKFYVQHLFQLCDILEVAPQEILRGIVASCENETEE